MTVQQVGDPLQVGRSAHQPAPRRRQRRPPAAGHERGSTGSASIFRRKADALVTRLDTELALEHLGHPVQRPQRLLATALVQQALHHAEVGLLVEGVLRDELLPPAGRPQQVEPA